MTLGTFGSTTSVVILTVVLVPGGVVGRQAAAAPSIHFGAIGLPSPVPDGTVALTLNRFTPYGQGPVQTQAGTYNSIRQSIGLNMLALSATGRLSVLPRTLYRLTVQSGFTHSQPTEFFQNDVVHKLWKVPAVPDVNPRERWEGGLGIEVNHWERAPHPLFPFFIGTGAAFSTVYNEVYAQTGIRAYQAGPSVMVRAGATIGGSAFPDRGVAERYVLVQTTLRVPLDQWLGWNGFPAVTASYLKSTGLFAGPDGRGIREPLCSVELNWRVVSFETWNDSWCEDSDWGPTYGVALTFRSLAFRLLNWL